MKDVYIIETHADIVNPKSDRRSKDWDKAPAIKAGSRFVVRATVDGYSTISPAEGYGWVARHSDLGKMIVENSVSTGAASVKELMIVNDCDWSESEVLRIMLKLGRITPADFAAVAAVPEGF